MATKPEFIVVPGACKSPFPPVLFLTLNFKYLSHQGHGPDSFAPTTSFLEKANYRVHGVTIPSWGASPPLKNFDPDVLAIQDVLNSVLSSGKDVVLIMHSYGGVVGSEALKEYVNEVATGKGGKQGWGKVRRLVFVAAFVMPEVGVFHFTSKGL